MEPIVRVERIQIQKTNAIPVTLATAESNDFDDTLGMTEMAIDNEDNGQANENNEFDEADVTPAMVEIEFVKVQEEPYCVNVFFF